MLRDVLDGVGNEEKERLFRMNITLCMHRACTYDEVAGLPHNWQVALSGMAGGPVEVIWSKNVSESPSAKPCEKPEHILPDTRRVDLWLPGDCGKCGPCLARAEIQRTINQQR